MGKSAGSARLGIGSGARATIAEARGRRPAVSAGLGRPSASAPVPVSSEGGSPAARGPASSAPSRGRLARALLASADPDTLTLIGL